MKPVDQDQQMKSQEEPQEVSFEWVESRFGLSRNTLRSMIREGLIIPVIDRPEPCLSPVMVERLAFILYLQRELGVNMAGIEIILDLKSRLTWHAERMNLRESRITSLEIHLDHS